MSISNLITHTVRLTSYLKKYPVPDFKVIKDFKWFSKTYFDLLNRSIIAPLQNGTTGDPQNDLLNKYILELLPYISKYNFVDKSLSREFNYFVKFTNVIVSGNGSVIPPIIDNGGGNTSVSYSFDVYISNAALSFSFELGLDTPPIEISVDWGDENISAASISGGGSEPFTHTYSANGNYTIIFTVDNPLVITSFNSIRLGLDNKIISLSTFSEFSNISYLEITGNDISNVNLLGLSNLNYLDLTNNNINTIERLGDCPVLTTLIIPNNQISTLDITGNSGLQNINISENPNLETIDIGSLEECYNFNGNNAILDTASVDLIIDSLAANPINDGLLDLGGNNAIPTLLSQVTILENKNWLVTVNS